MRKNRNRGYQKLTVWNDAIEYYVLTCDVFRAFPFELKRVASQQIASADSVHRNTCPVKSLGVVFPAACGVKCLCERIYT